MQDKMEVIVYHYSRQHDKKPLIGPLVVRKCDINKKTWKLYRLRGEVSATVYELGCNISFYLKRDAVRTCKELNAKMGYAE